MKTYDPSNRGYFTPLHLDILMHCISGMWTNIHSLPSNGTFAGAKYIGNLIDENLLEANRNTTGPINLVRITVKGQNFIDELCKVSPPGARIDFQAAWARICDALPLSFLNHPVCGGHEDIVEAVLRKIEHLKGIAANSNIEQQKAWQLVWEKLISGNPDTAFGGLAGQYCAVNEIDRLQKRSNQLEVVTKQATDLLKDNEALKTTIRTLELRDIEMSKRVEKAGLILRTGEETKTALSPKFPRLLIHTDGDIVVQLSLDHFRVLKMVNWPSKRVGEDLKGSLWEGTFTLPNWKPHYPMTGFPCILSCKTDVVIATSESGGELIITASDNVGYRFDEDSMPWSNCLAWVRQAAP